MKQLSVTTSGRGLSDITSRVDHAIHESGVSEGLATVFIHHTSASLVITENADPDVRVDLEAFFSRLVTDADPLFVHVAEGADDMSAHVRGVLTQTSIGIPIAKRRCDLGTWQGVYVWEHRYASHHRRISVTIVGE